MDTQDYIEVALKVASEEQAEIVEALVSDLGFDSFQYEEGEQPVLKCYIQSSLFVEDDFKDALTCLPDFTLEFEVSKMEAADWNEEWEKTGFTVIEVGDVRVCPAGCEEVETDDSKMTIWLNPKMAFGTGHHETTYMMMATMQDIREEIAGKSVMDLGCGTAVLAILAAKLGASHVSAIDIDATAVRSSLGNVHLNGLDFEVICGDASSLKEGAYDVLLANIHRNIIIADLQRYAGAVRQGGRLLLSGFYESDVPDIVAAAAAAGFTLVSSRTRSSWACLCLSRG